MTFFGCNQPRLDRITHQLDCDNFAGVYYTTIVFQHGGSADVVSCDKSANLLVRRALQMYSYCYCYAPSSLI